MVYIPPHKRRHTEGWCECGVQDVVERGLTSIGPLMLQNGKPTKFNHIFEYNIQTTNTDKSIHQNHSKNKNNKNSNKNNYNYNNGPGTHATITFEKQTFRYFKGFKME